MVSAILSRLVILVFGTLYPAYASYKAVRTKNVKEYVKWMMYWIVFALFCTVETFSDFFLSWFPFYYEFKIIFVLWMLSPITQGSSFLFKKFVHPQLARREKDIDEMIDQATKQGYSAFVDLGNKGIKVILKSVIMGQSKLADHLRRSYSTSDLSNDGHDIVQRQEVLGDQEDNEEELDNRLIEDQEELTRLSASVTKSKSSSSAFSLSSVKEEDGEDNEHVITETFTIPSSTRRHYSVREDKTATRQLRCQSLPPFADKYTKPLVIASTNLESKRQYFTKFQSVEKKEISCNAPSQDSLKLDSKKHLLIRSLSQDSGTANMLNTISSFANRSGLKTGKADVARIVSDNKDKITAEEKTLNKSDSVIRTDSQIFLSKEVSHQQNIEPEIKNDDSVGKDIEIYTEEEMKFMRRSVPRFQNELPAIDEVAPLELAPKFVIKDMPGGFSQHSSHTQKAEDLMLLQVYGDITGGPRLSLLPADILGDDLSNLIFLDVEEDLDDQCSTPVAKDSPPNLSLDDEIKDTVTEKKADGDLNKDEDSIYTDDDVSSVSDFKSLDETNSSTSDFKSLDERNNDFDTFSEGSSNVNWETLSEASISDSSECHTEDVQESSALEDVSGPWSAPSSPASFIRGSKYEEDALQYWNTPTSLLMHQRNKDKDEASWSKSRVQRQMSLPSSVSRNILHSWPSPSQFPDSSSSRTREKMSAKSYGHSFDPFKTWHPPSRSAVTSYRSQSIDSPSAAYLQRKTFSLSEKSRYPYVRSASADLAGGEALYSRYSESAYSTNPLSPRTHSHPRSGSLSTGRSSTSMSHPSMSRPSMSHHYPTKTYSYYTSKK